MKLRFGIAAVAALLAAGCDIGGDSGGRRNEAPTISAIADQNTTANEQSMAIAFTVSDEDIASLALSVTSDNQDVVPDSGLVLGGSGENRTLTAAPTVDELGDAFVTIIVTDAEGLAASTSFLLTVVPQQMSLQQFTRTKFADGEDDDPELINAIEFDQDADGDDFADLLQ